RREFRGRRSRGRGPASARALAVRSFFPSSRLAPPGQLEGLRLLLSRLLALPGSCNPGGPDREFEAHRGDVGAPRGDARGVCENDGKEFEEMFRASRVLAATGVVAAAAIVWLALGVGGVFSAAGAPKATTTTSPTRADS